MISQPSHLLVKPATQNYFLGNNILFVHNWRTGGTSLHVLLKANILSRYIKIGDQFSRFGKTSNMKPLSTLAEVRKRLSPGSIVAGHLYAGVESLLPGAWDLWISAREPLARLRSGLLRFHSRELPNFNTRSHNIIHSTPSLGSPESLRAVLSTTLLHENNGMARRLACLPLARSYAVNESSNLEKPEFLSDSYADNALYATAMEQLKRIRVVFMADQLNASILCLESCYDLPPIINPFVKLHCNRAKLVGYEPSHVECLDQSDDILRETQKVDLALWPLLQARFKMQMKQYSVNQDQIKAKELIHSSALFSPDWFQADSSLAQTVDMMAKAVYNRLKNHEHLSEHVINMVCDWPCLSQELREVLRQKLA